MKKKINPLGLLLACCAALCLIGVLLGAKQHFFGFLTLGGLSYALLTEKPQQKKSINQ